MQNLRIKISIRYKDMHLSNKYAELRDLLFNQHQPYFYFYQIQAFKKSFALPSVPGKMMKNVP